MGIQRENGYSSSVKAFLAIKDRRIRIAKVGKGTLTFARPVELPPGTEGTMVVSVDDHRTTRKVSLDDGACFGQRTVRYRELVPF
jgi:hypothetical protein